MFSFKITIALASIGVIYAGIIDHHGHGYHIVTKHDHHHGGHHDGGFGGGEAAGLGGFGGDFGAYGGGYDGGDSGHHDYYVRYRVVDFLMIPRNYAAYIVAGTSQI